MENILFTANGRMFACDGTKSRELPCRILDEYRTRVAENAKRKEWKTSGEGAMFTGAIENNNAESAVKNIRAYITSICPVDGGIAYSLAIDNVCGIYMMQDGTSSDGILISDSNYKYSHINTNGESFVLCSSFAGESHIGVMKNANATCEILTEGTSRELWPSWSMAKPQRIIYSGCGLAQDPKVAESREKLKSYPAMILEQYEDHSYIEGPYSIYALDLSTYELETLLEDESQKFSYIKPYEAEDGYLYYIKKPYADVPTKGSIGDALMAPVRLIGAVGGFLNFFTIKYSGKTLTKSAGDTKSKQMSEEKMFIDGNLFEAGRELENNRKKGEENPGVIPNSYKLCRRAQGGKEEVIKSGVIAYAVRDSGEILCSDGLHLISLSESDGKINQKVLLNEKAISFIYAK